MTNARWVVIVIAVATGTAQAQPGNTPPQPYPPPQPQPYPAPQQEPAPPGGAPGETPPPPPPPPQAQYGIPQTGYHVGPVDVDQVIAKVASEAPTLKTVAYGTLRRARRAIAFGPTIGYWGGVVLAQDTYEHALTFGLALEVFKVPILPDSDTIKALILERVKGTVKEQLFARLGGRPADPVTVEGLVKEIYNDVRQEVLGLENRRNKHMERPKFNIGLEANRYWRAEQWAPRLRVGVGIWKFTLGGSIDVALGGRTKVYTGLEVVLHYLTNNRERSPVIDFFVRADFEVRDRDMNGDQLVLGTRFLLDAI
jgi:hypothetical protein